MFEQPGAWFYWLDGSFGHRDDFWLVTEILLNLRRFTDPAVSNRKRQAGAMALEARTAFRSCVSLHILVARLLVLVFIVIWWFLFEGFGSRHCSVRCVDWFNMMSVSAKIDFDGSVVWERFVVRRQKVVGWKCRRKSGSWRFRRQ